MTEDQFNIISEKLDKLHRGQKNFEKSLDYIGADLEHDRGNLQEFTIRLSAVESELRELRKSHNSQAEKIEEKVEDKMIETIEPAVKEVKKLKETIKEKKFVTLRNKFKWKFWEKRG